MQVRFPTMLMLLLVMEPSVLGPTTSFEIVDTTNRVAAVSIWSTITFGAGGAYSTLIERAIEDCLRPNRVDCFSIQQNSWISDSLGNMVLWAQNAIELARLDGAAYYGTFTFQIWNGTAVRQPVACEPRSSRENQCRAPFYTDRVPFPQTFSFYSHISNNASKYELRMSNNLGAMNWPIPKSVKCPCYLGTSLENAPPWGHYPFELVTVGLDSSSMAVFRNDTIGAFGPVLVQSADGFWRDASLDTLRCRSSTGCIGMLATAENSMNLVWNTTSKRFYWSNETSDQGVYISSISDPIVTPPTIPNPMIETYIYAEFTSFYAYLTIYDEEQRALGVDPRSGKRVEQIPNSSITHNRSEDLLIVNPTGEYDLVITAGGNTMYGLFVSKTTNIGYFLASQSYSGTLSIGYSVRLHLNAADMRLSTETSSLATNVLPVAGIVATLVGLVGLIAAILFIRRRHSAEEQRPL